MSAATTEDPGALDLRKLRAGIMPDWLARRAGVSERRILVVAHVARGGEIDVIGRVDGGDTYVAARVEIATGQPRGALCVGPDCGRMFEAQDRFRKAGAA